MQDLAADTEDHPADEHDRPLVAVAPEPVDGLPHHAEHAGDDHYDAGALRVDQDAAQQWHYHVGERVQGV